MKRYTTVGVPGGEFVVEAESWMAAKCKLDKLANEVVDGDGCVTNVHIRTVPPDLAAWLDAKKEHGEIKVPGGWLYIERDEYGRVTNSHFVPVALSAGITIMQEAK